MKFGESLSLIKPERTLAKLEGGQPVTIAAIGDSLTQGWMARKGYLDFLKEMLRQRFPQGAITIIGRGVPGDTADNGLYRLRYDVLDHHPDCVLVQFAINDASMGFTTTQFRGYIRRIIEAIRDAGEADIILLTSSYIGDNGDNQFVEAYYDQLEELAILYGLPVARVHTYWKDRIDEGIPFGSLVQFDMVHPTVEGYRLMAEAIMILFR